MRNFLLAAVTLLLVPQAAADDPVADRVLEGLQRGRSAAGSPALERRTDLDDVARARVLRIAELPHEQRLAHGEPIGDLLREAGIVWYSGASSHLDMVRGYPRPEVGLLRSWRGHEGAWREALNPRFESVGAASRRADDGWIVLVAVLVDEMPIPDDMRLVEQATIEAVNRVRRGEGLADLEEDSRLSQIAREHSADMAGRDYFDHASPEGLRAAERVDRAGLTYGRVAENIQMSRGVEDPVERAISSWLSSPGHRQNLFDPGFSRTGVGVALAADGRIYFTQLFLQ